MSAFTLRRVEEKKLNMRMVVEREKWRLYLTPNFAAVEFTVCAFN